MAHIESRDHIRVNVDRVILDGHHAKDDEIHIDSNKRLDIRTDVKVASDKKFLMNNIYDENENVVLTTGGGSATLGVPLDLNNKTISNASGISIEASQVNKSTNSQLYNDLAGELGNLHSGVSDVKNAVFDLGTSNRGKIIVVGNPSNDMEVGGIEADNILTTTANKTISGTLTMNNLTANKFLKLNSSKQIITGDAAVDFADLTGGASIGQIPDLPASKITEGAFADDRIGPLNASKIISGTIADARLPTNIVRTDVADQTISSSITIDGGTGDSVLTLIADSDNANEGDNAFINMIQDGGTSSSGGTRFTVGLNSDNDLFMGCNSNSGFFGGMVLQTNGSGTGNNQKPIIFKPQLSETCRIDQNGISLTSGKTYKINNTQIDFDDLANSGNIDSARLNTEISPVIIPNLDTAKITTGTLDNARLSLDANAIPALPASKITSGTLGVDRIPSLSANKITSDTLGADRIPTLSANKIGSDTLSIDRIPTITDAKLPTNILRDDVASQTISNTSANTELNIKVRSNVSTYNPVLKLSKHNSSDVAQEQLTMTLTDTALESNTDTAYIYKVGTAEKLRVSGSSVKINDTLNINDKIQLQGANPGANSVIQIGTDGTASFVASSTFGGTNASNLSTGTINNSLLNLDAATIPDLPTSKITSGTFDLARIPVLTADKLPDDITVNRIKFDDADVGTDSTNSPSIHDFEDSLFFDVNTGESFVFKVNGSVMGKIDSNGLHDFINCDLKTGGQFKINGSQIDFDDLANTGNIDSARITAGTIADARLPTNIIRSDVDNQAISCDTFTLQSGTDGDCNFIIRADTDNSNEDDNPRITFKQDGDAIQSVVGLQNSDNAFFINNKANQPTIFKFNGTETGRITTGGFNLASGKTYQVAGSQINFNNIANSGNIDSARLNTEIHIDRIPTLTADKLPDDITVNRIKFDDADVGTDSTNSPSIHDFEDSLFFDVNTGESFVFKVNGSIMGKIDSNGLHDFINCDLKTGGQFKINGTQISSSALSNDSSIIKNNVDAQAIACSTFNLQNGSGSNTLILQANTTNLGSGNPVISLRKNGGLAIAEIKQIDTDNALVIQTGLNTRPIIFKIGADEYKIKTSGITIPSGKTYQVNDTQIALANLSDGNTVLRTGTAFSGDLEQTSGTVILGQSTDNVSTTGVRIYKSLDQIGVLETSNGILAQNLGSSNVAISCNGDLDIADANRDITKTGVSYGVFERLSQITPGSWTTVSAAGTTLTANNVVFKSGFTSLSSVPLKFKVVDYGGGMRHIFLRGTIKRTDGSDMAENTSMIDLGSNLTPTETNRMIMAADASLSDHHFHSCVIQIGSDGVIQMWRKLLNSEGVDALTASGTQGILKGNVETIRINTNYWTD